MHMVIVCTCVDKNNDPINSKRNGCEMLCLLSFEAVDVAADA